MHTPNAVFIALFFNFDIWMEEVHHLKVAIRGHHFCQVATVWQTKTKDCITEGWGWMEKFLKFILPKVNGIIVKLLKAARRL